MVSKAEEKISSRTSGLFQNMKPLNQMSMEEPEKKKVDQDPKDKPVSVWMGKRLKRSVKAYSTATGKSVSGLVNDALTEYMERHTLTGKQKIIPA